MNDIEKIHHIAMSPLDCNIDHEEDDTLTVQRVKALAYLVRSQGQQLAYTQRKLEAAEKDAERYKDALQEIALAGMSLPMVVGDDEEARQRFHAKQAWNFIGIAARAVSPDRALEQIKGGDDD